jgi:MSHA biogenesis protein MshM
MALNPGRLVKSNSQMNDGQYEGPAEPPSTGREDLVALLPSRLKLLYGVVAELLAGKTLVAMNGEPGIGKSVLARALAYELQRHRIASIMIPGANNRPLQVQHAIDAVLGIRMMNVEQPWRLRAAMLGKPAFAIVCDDADRLPVATLRYLWLLHRLLNVDMIRLYVILIGGVALQTVLRQSGLTTLLHFASSYVIVPLDDGEARAYLAHTFRSRGQVPRQVMHGAAAVELLGLARGIPREIDALANSALERFERNGHRKLVRSALHETSQVDDWLGNEFPSIASQRGWGAAIIASLAILVVGGVIGGNAGLFSGPADSSILAVQMAELDRAHEAQLGGQPSEAEPQSAAAVGAKDSADQVGLPLPPANSQGAPGAEAGDETKPATAPFAADARPPSKNPEDGPPADAGSTPAEMSVSELPDKLPPPQASLIAPNAGSTVAGPTEITPTVMPPLAQPPVEPGSARLAPGATPRLGGPGLALMVKEGDTIMALYAKVYRGLTPPPYAAVLAINRIPVKPGAILVFPEPPGGWRYPEGATRDQGVGAL